MRPATAKALEILESRHIARIKPWREAAFQLIGVELGDALAHARAAVTETLKRTPDGRASAAKIRRSRSYASALGHLDKLLDELAGPSADSQAGLVRDAAESFYRDAFRDAVESVDPELRVSPNPKPKEAGIRKIRTAYLHSSAIRDELGALVLSARRSLGPSVASAAARGNTEVQARDSLTTWHAQATRSIERGVLAVLSDLDVASRSLSLIDAIHPSRLDPESLAMSSHA